MSADKIRPQDEHLMQPDLEYCYMYCDIDYGKMTATVCIETFTIGDYNREHQYDVTEHGLRQIVAQYEAEGWAHVRAEHGREYEGHYFQRRKNPSVAEDDTKA